MGGWESWPYPPLPLSFVVRGTALSRRASSSSRERWSRTIRDAAREACPKGFWLVSTPLAVTIYLFPQASIEGDVDNLAKVILDALKGALYEDDGQVERLVVQKFGPGTVLALPSEDDPLLDRAIASEEAVVYVRLSSDLA